MAHVTMGSVPGLAAAAVATGALIALHLVAPRLRRLSLTPESVTASFAGGTAAAYVFLHILPELAEGNERVGELLEGDIVPTPLTDLGLYAITLGGFVALFGLDRLAKRHQRPDADVAPNAVFAIHLGVFAGINAIATYTMPLRFRTGADFAVLFTIAIGLHYLLVDRGMVLHYPRRFPRYGRQILAGALAGGWLLAAVVPPSRTAVVSILVAALAGFILVNVFMEELPSERAGHYGWFVIGVVAYAALLAAATAAGD